MNSIYCIFKHAKRVFCRRFFLRTHFLLELFIISCWLFLNASKSNNWFWAWCCCCFWFCSKIWLTFWLDDCCWFCWSSSCCCSAWRCSCFSISRKGRFWPDTDLLFIDLQNTINATFLKTQSLTKPATKLPQY